MQVMGFTRREVARVLVGENVLLTAVALLPGLGLGLGFCYLLSITYDTDLFRFPFMVEPRSIVFTVSAVAVFALLANLAVRRKLGAMDLTEVLKARE